MHVRPRWVYWIEIKNTLLLQVLLPDDRCTRLANKNQRHTNTTCNIPGPYKGLVILIIYINGIWFRVMSCRMQRFNWNRFVTGVNIVIGVVVLCVFGYVIALAKSDISPSVLFLHIMYGNKYISTTLQKIAFFKTCIIYRQANEYSNCLMYICDDIWHHIHLYGIIFHIKSTTHRYQLIATSMRK